MTAKMFALAAYGLLKEKAQRSRELVDQYEPVFKKFSRVCRIYGTVRFKRNI